LANLSYRVKMRRKSLSRQNAFLDEMALLVGRLIEAEGPYAVRGVGHDGVGTAIVEPVS
jgi:hypothetical protein